MAGWILRAAARSAILTDNLLAKRAGACHSPPPGYWTKQFATTLCKAEKGSRGCRLVASRTMQCFQHYIELYKTEQLHGLSRIFTHHPSLDYHTDQSPFTCVPGLPACHSLARRRFHHALVCIRGPVPRNPSRIRSKSSALLPRHHPTRCNARSATEQWPLWLAGETAEARHRAQTEWIMLRG